MTRYLINLAALADLARQIIPAASVAALDASDSSATHCRLVVGLEYALDAVTAIREEAAPPEGAPALAGPPSPDTGPATTITCSLVQLSREFNIPQDVVDDWWRILSTSHHLSMESNNFASRPFTHEESFSALHALAQGWANRRRSQATPPSPTPPRPSDLTSNRNPVPAVDPAAAEPKFTTHAESSLLALDIRNHVASMLFTPTQGLDLAHSLITSIRDRTDYPNTPVPIPENRDLTPEELDAMLVELAIGVPSGIDQIRDYARAVREGAPAASNRYILQDATHVFTP